MKAFDIYVKKRLEERSEGPEVLAEIKKDFYQLRMIDLLNALGFSISVSGTTEFENAIKNAGIKIITIRTAFDKQSELLKPVATFPQKLLKIAESFAHHHKPKKTFKYNPENIDGFRMWGPQQLPTGYNEKIQFSGIFNEAKILESIKKKSIRQQRLPYFAKRILTAIDEMREEAKSFFKPRLNCFFSVSATHFTVNCRVNRILAIYWDPKSTKKDFSQIEEIKVDRICSEIFANIEQIQKIDNDLLLLEGHELVSSLQPTFLDEDIAPADKIAFAVEKFKKLVKRHLESHYPATDKKKVDPEVYFITVTYEAIEEHEHRYKYRPNLQVYPHVYRTKHALSAFYISHPSHIAITKLLLKEYITQNNKDEDRFVLGPPALLQTTPSIISFHDDFMEELFKEYNALQQTTIKERFTDYSKRKDRIFASLPESADELEKKMWKQLNVAVKGKEHVSSSILAYVIEGRKLNLDTKQYLQLPRAILVIEGQREELFSKDEQTSLRVIVKAFANLVRHIFHDNSLLDYRPQLSKAYDPFLRNALGSTARRKRRQRFLLASMAVDVDMLDKIREEVRDLDCTIFPTDLDKIYKEVFEGTGETDKDMTEDMVKEKIHLRAQRSLSYVRKEMDDSTKYPISEDVVNFIESCPRNFAWAGYAPSLTQALGDRTGHSPPRFELMTPGYSASGLYMAVVESELQQVAKLSSLAKLKKERDNYRKFVRYKVLLAARTPANALAFDSQGNIGFEEGKKDGNFTLNIDRADYEKQCHGVLVSDLASSKKLSNSGNGQNGEVLTFQERAWEAVSAPERDVLDSVIQSIKNLFGNNLGHWFGTEYNADEGKTLVHAMMSALRLDYRDEDMRGTDPDDFKGYKISEFFSELMEVQNINEDRCFKVKLRGETADGNGNGSVNVHKVTICPNKIFQFATLKYSGVIDYPQIEQMPKLTCVVHGDLNSRNLVWAGPIEHFMMIDFEHVAVGLWGIDQSRLAVNTVVDHMADLLRKQRLEELEDGINLELREQVQAIAEAANFLVDEIRYNNLAKENIRSDAALNDDKQNRLKVIIQEILYTTVETYNRIFNEDLPKYKNWLAIYKHSLGLVVVKEYEYALKNLLRSGLEKANFELFVSSYNAEKSSYKDKNGDLNSWLLVLLTSPAFKVSAFSPEQVDAVFRYAITFWIFDNIIKDLDFSRSED